MQPRLNWGCIETRERFARALTATLCGIYLKPTPDADTIKLWFFSLAELSIEEFQRGLKLHIKDTDAGQFPPKPADVLRHIQGTSGANASLAWGKVLEAMQRVGGYASVDFGDAAIHCAVRDLGGWPLLCASDRDDLPFVQKRFEAAYKAYLSAGTAGAQSELLGIDASNCVIASAPLPEPIQLGHHRSAPALPNPAHAYIAQAAGFLEMAR